MNGRRFIGKLTNHNIFEGEVWFANFPLEEDSTQFLPRPVVVLDADSNSNDILVIKVTKIDPRPQDEFDTSIDNWQYASLNYKSTARVSKTQYVNRNQFKHKLGDLHPSDLVKLQIRYMEYVSSQC